MARAQPPHTLLKFSAFDILKKDPRPANGSTSKKPRTPAGTAAHVVGGVSAIPLETVSPVMRISSQRLNRPDPTSPFAVNSKKQSWRPKQANAASAEMPVLKLESSLNLTKENQPENVVEVEQPQPQESRIAHRRPKRAAARVAVPPPQRVKPEARNNTKRNQSARGRASRRV